MGRGLGGVHFAIMEVLEERGSVTAHFLKIRIPELVGREIDEYNLYNSICALELFEFIRRDPERSIDR